MSVIDFSAFCQEMGREYGWKFGSCDWDIHDHENGCVISLWNGDESLVFSGPDIQTVLDLTRAEAALWAARKGGLA